MKKRRFLAVSDLPAADLVARQMEATAMAYKVLGTADAARIFLNEVDQLLGGRPLDVAGGSAEGLGRVTEALALIHRVPPAEVHMADQAQR